MSSPLNIAAPGGFLQISDPKAGRGRPVGIDLGTTNSLVAVIEDGRPRCLPMEDGGSALLPSVVQYRAGEAAPLVGQRAKETAKDAPADTLASVKRFMGKSADDAETRRLQTHRFAEGDGRAVRFLAGGRPVTPVEVSAEILRTLKKRAERVLSQRVEKAVITVPAYFDDAQRQATKDAGRLAGLEVLRLLNEPTAAALAYGLDKGSQGTFAVYDLGGGTFDISILKLIDGVFEVKSTGGDSALGGDDFDRAMAGALLAEMGEKSPSPELVHAVLAEARRAKETLTSAASVDVRIQGFSRKVSRAELEAWIAPLIERTAGPCKRALKDAGLAPGQLDGVILVGGSTRVPAVRAFVARLFERQPLGDIDPDQVVALGAAIQADLLGGTSSRNDVLLLDVLPLSLGLETMGGVVEKIIPRNSTIPTSATQVFTTFADGQNGMDIHVLQGERELVKDCRSLAKFRLSGIPALPAGMARIAVTFQVDADGLLQVMAKELSTGLEQSIAVKPSHGLTDEEVEKMLIDSLEHADEDVKERLLAEARVEGERILASARQALAHDGALLDPSETPPIHRALTWLSAALDGADLADMQAAMAELDKVSQGFAQKRMDRAIQGALAGHRVEEFEGP